MTTPVTRAGRRRAGSRHMSQASAAPKLSHAPKASVRPKHSSSATMSTQSAARTRRRGTAAARPSRKRMMTMRYVARSIGFSYGPVIRPYTIH